MRRIIPFFFTPLLFAGFLLAAEKQAPAASTPPMLSRGPEFPMRLPTFGETETPGWTRVNENARHKMPTRMATRCFIPKQKQWRGDHADAFTEVFVNDTGKAAMFAVPMANPARPGDPVAILFPVGSVIIKVKYASEKGGGALLRTVMIKRAAGYNPECGDWEFVVTDGTGLQVGERGKIQRCMECHQKKWIEADDHTFRRDYLPESVLKAIRLADPVFEPDRSKKSKS